MKLEYDDLIVTFRFEGIVDFHSDGDPRATYAFRFWCYPCFDDKDLLTFDVEYYKIICSRIIVEAVEQITDVEQG